MKIIECPRDAMQGIKDFIPTTKKVAYLNSLLKVGFDTLDFGSFVSPMAIPQMRDTANVLSQLNDSNTSLLAIVANQRGADEACSFERINFIGYPFSISEIFQQRNTNKSVDQSLTLVEELQIKCERYNKSLIVYLSMAFGNPYSEYWHEDIVAKWGEKLSNLGVKTIALSDTVGVSNPNNIKPLFSLLTQEYPHIEWGAHFHTHLESWREKIETAFNSGCRRFDGAIKGYGGCPMANDLLVGNMPTEKLLSFIQEKKYNLDINTLAFESAYNKAIDLFE
ncbi:MAG: hydroxymethylglutaryl-CoA lyase [Flavobacteriales bacterium]|nr:hydroxymethylglutaryl-CoA lyase [Flavobacteriales bacterium]